MADGSFAELRAELKQRADGKALPLPHAGEPLYRSMSIRAIRKDKREVDFVCSTESLDSHGTILAQDWDRDGGVGLSRFSANPVILYNHNISMRDLPIGQGRNVHVEGEGADRQLVATVWFSEKTQLAREAWELVEEGTLRGISVGFDWSSLRFEERGDVEIIVLYGLELIELSITPTPSNGDCLARQLRARAGAPLTRPDASSKPLTTPTPKAAERSAQAPSARKDKTMTEEEIKATITEDGQYLVSLENGKKYRSLKKHLTGAGLTPDQYRAKWGLPDIYPMNSVGYSLMRRDMALAAGLGKGKKGKAK